MPRCDGMDIQLSAYVDGELEGVAVAAVESHLKGCPECAARVESERRLQAGFRRHLSPMKAPPGLRANVSAAIAAEGKPKSPGTFRLGAWVGLAATVAVAVLAGREWGTLSVGHRSATIADQVVAAHVRSLQLSHLTDVAASDHHTVKPWFAGKLDYSPPVPVLDSLGFRLIGGRLDYVLNRPTAVVVYGRREHMINLFLWPAGDSTATTETTSDRGYQSVHGAAGGLAFWAISDLNAAELRDFVRAAMQR